MVIYYFTNNIKINLNDRLFYCNKNEKISTNLTCWHKLIEVKMECIQEVQYYSKSMSKAVSALKTAIRNLGKIADGDSKYALLQGWISACRIQGKIVFLILRDGTDNIQVMIPKHILNIYRDLVQLLKREASITIFGTVHTDKRAPTGLEVHAVDFEIVGKSAGIDQINDDSKIYDLLNYRHLVLRGDPAMSVMKVRHYVQKYLREFFDLEGCYEVTPPTITQGECEGGSTVFKFKYYDQDASLTQSSQLYLETMVPVMKRVFCILPSFRAERSTTRRHLSEFTHVEAEFAFISFDNLLSFIERMVHHVCSRLKEGIESSQLLAKLNPKFKVPSIPFKRMRYADAILYMREHKIYKDAEAGSYYEYGDDIPEAPERKLVDIIGEPIFLTHFPNTMKAFYMDRDPENDDETLSADLLYPGVGEIVGGSMRLWDYDKLMEGFELNKIDPSKYEYYTDQRKYGTCPHGGFGLGLERLVMCLADQESVKVCCLYPRFFPRCTP
jgi:asparaginyl-tRNA synthetase